MVHIKIEEVMNVIHKHVLSYCVSVPLPEFDNMHRASSDSEVASAIYKSKYLKETNFRSCLNTN